MPNTNSGWEARPHPPRRPLAAAVPPDRKKRPYAEEGHPAPISSDGARVQLWDGEQTDAYYAG